MSSTSRPSTPLVPTVQISHPAHTLLQQAHSSNSSAAIFTDKIKNKPLLLQASTTTQRDKRSLRRHIRVRKKQYYLQHQRPRPLSAQEKRRLGVHDLKPAEVKYDIYKKLNHMWTGYILEVLGLSNASGDVLDDALDGRRTVSVSSAGSLIASADYHGMEIEVTRATDVGRVGLKGIVVRDTRSTLVVVTKSDKCVRVTKAGCIFKVTIDLSAHAATRRKAENDKIPAEEEEEDEEEEAVKTAETDRDPNRPGRTLTFEIHGSQIEHRPTERAVRKMKWKNMEYL